MFKVIVTYFYESDTHIFDKEEDAINCFNKYCTYSNTYVELVYPDGSRKTNGKEYLF